MARADIDAILENINTRLASDYIEAFGDFLVATVLRNPVQLRAARLRLEDVVRESMGSAEVLGALSTLRVAARPLAAGLPANLRADRMALVAFSGEDARRILTRVTFTEALDDFVDRAPVVVQRAAERTAATIARLYREGDVVAFAKSAEDAVTQRAQDLIGQAMREGIPERQIGRTIAFDVNRIRSESAAWTESYARMAFRTNLNDAVSQGRLRMAQDADVKAVVPAMRFTAVGDHDTRSNHAAADGVILRVDNPAWRFMRPPFGYNCRCQLDHVSRGELATMGQLDSAGKVIESRIPPGARPDEGFR